MTDVAYLKTIKAILIVRGLIKQDTILCEKSWLSYKESFTPVQAVKEDIGFLPYMLSWEDVVNKIKEL